jgi:uncharacterized membrane protein YccC
MVDQQVELFPDHANFDFRLQIDLIVVFGAAIARLRAALAEGDLPLPKTPDDAILAAQSPGIRGMSFGWLARYRLEAGLTVRMSAAGLISFAVAHLLGLTQVYWAVLTAVIVMQASIGGSLKAMLDRFIGTIGGAGWGVAVTLAVPHGNVVSTGLALAVALVPLAAIVAFRPSYRVAPVTAAIVLLAYGGQTGVVAAALDRVFEIGLGSIVALGVALLVSPARAHDLLGAAGGGCSGPDERSGQVAARRRLDTA